MDSCGLSCTCPQSAVQGLVQACTKGHMHVSMTFAAHSSCHCQTQSLDTKADMFDFPVCMYFYRGTADVYDKADKISNAIHNCGTAQQLLHGSQKKFYGAVKAIAVPSPTRFAGKHAVAFDLLASKVCEELRNNKQ